jgi:hypothetical protein
MTVSITPVGSNRQRFALDFSWKTTAASDEGARNRTNDAASPRGSVSWSGRVDDQAIVDFQGQQMVTRALKGKPVESARATFLAPIPTDGTRVRLENIRGPGKVELVQQPSAENGYIASVRIEDPGMGAGDYSFTLVWGGPPNAAKLVPGIPGAVITQSAFYRQLGFNGMRWSGRVDDRVRVTVQGDRVSAERIDGEPLYNERAEFSAALPGESDREVRVAKVRGRGSVNLIEKPSSSNGYRLVFEVSDGEPGADDYQTDVSW